MADDNSSAQEQQPAVSGEPEAQKPNGAEARINELYARSKEQERQLEAKDLQITAMLQSFANQNNQPVSHEPAPEIDPEERKKIEYLVNPQVKALQAQVEQLLRSQVNSQFQAVQANLPREVLERAKELQYTWTKEGKQGWVAQDAARYALGEFYERQGAQGHARNDQRDFNSASQNVNFSQAAPPPVAQRQYQLPKNIDSLPIHEQIALYEKAGLGDVPLE